MRILFVLAAVVVAVDPATAQPAAAIAVGGGVSHRMGMGSDECDACTPLVEELGGEVAVFATDSLAVLAGVGLGSFGIDVSADDTGLDLDSSQLRTLLGRYGHVDCTRGHITHGRITNARITNAQVTHAQPVFCYPGLAHGNLISVTVLTVGSGLRYYGPPGRARFFAEVEVGVSRSFRTLEVSELRESRSVTERHIRPGAGVAIAVNDRAAVQVSGGGDIGRLDGETLHSAGVGAGLVFDVGRR